MATWPFSFVPTWFFFCVTVVLATNISNEFSSFIPSCAGECFASFLNVNYAQDVFEASDRVIENAYDICNGRPDAVHPTYLTITATLVLAPSGGVVTFPSVTTKTTSRPDTSSTIHTLPTTLVIDTSSPPAVPRPSTETTTRSTAQSTAREHSTTDSSDDSDIISISEPPFTKPTTFETSTSTLTSSSETETSTEAPGGAGGASKDENSDDSDKLSTEQVAGISVGVLAAVGVAVGAIVLARYYRRRKYPQIKTGFLPMRDTWGYKPDRSDNAGHNSWMVHQLRPDLDPTNHPPPPPADNRRSVKPESIGIALSPPPSSRNTAVHTSPLRRLSKLLPAKPTLPDLSVGDSSEKPLPLLHPEQAGVRHQDSGPLVRDESSSIPPPTLSAAASPGRSKPTPPAPLKLQIPATEKLTGPLFRMSNRESNVTEFEEDRTSISPNANTQVWRPPTTPLSATTYYVADQYGNWVLGNPKRASVIARGSQDSKVSQEGASKPPPTNASGLLGSVEQNNTRTLAPPAEIIPAASQPRPTGPRSQYSSPFFSSQSYPRRSASIRRSMTRPLTQPREDSSSSSATIITTSTESSTSIPSLAPEQQVSLSPVVESPQSVWARQQQPQIPPRDPRRASQMGNPGVNINPRSAPPTRQIVYSPPGQPSPTLGMMQPPSAYYVKLQSKAQLQQQQQQLAPQRAQPTANAGLQTTSPTMRIVEPSPEPDETIDPATVNPDQIRTSPFYFDPPYPQPLHTGQPSQHRLSVSGPQVQQYRPYQRPPSFQPSPRQQQAAWQPVRRLHSQNHQQQRHQQQPQQQQNHWQLTQRMPPIYPSLQQQQPLKSYRRPNQHQEPYQQPQMYMSFQPQPGQQPYPRKQGSYQSFQPYHTQQQARTNPSQYQSFRPPQSMNPPLAHNDSQDSLLAKRVGSDRAAGMTIGTEKTGASKWNRDVQNKTPSNMPMPPNWQPTLTPTRRGDDLVLNVQ
ncbi:DEF1-coordinates repair and RNA pol II proteolysis in response to DNA damage [Fusarium beomiforme]|uniref:DEF1-coordinates repair and RNA pol II proteolysis in response to DNA damage n=1 Tax=Fusarium beomiforme TaxID=44412 RepID=A0A9P5A679_9HYPO|nr:DEF1-coordinates repair and RNA pol II proteolysis in response to DNA damage [Fusarium beomiforme]